MMKKRNKRGFSIVEAVIALSVVVLVSACALSIVLSSVKAKQAAINKTYAQNFANNALESFKNHSAEKKESYISTGNFTEYLCFTEGCDCSLSTTITESSGNQISNEYTVSPNSFKLTSHTDTQTSTTTFEYTSQSFTAVITIDYTTVSGSTDITGRFRIVVAGSNGKQLAELSYAKPVGIITVEATS